MPIRYRCPNCQKLLRAGSRSAGKKIACPACGDRHRVPELTPEVVEVAAVIADESLPGASKTSGQIEDCESYFQMPSAPPSKSAQPLRVDPQPAESFEREVEEDQDADEVGFTPGRRERPRDDLDLIPLVDCVFLLLIFYMISANYGTQKTISVAPPDPAKQGLVQVAEEEQDTPRESIIVRIDEQNLVYVDDIQLPDRKTLTDALTTRRTGSQDIELVVEADPAALQESLIAVIDAAQALKFDKIRVAPIGGDSKGF